MTDPKRWKGVGLAAYDPILRRITRCEACVQKTRLDIGWWWDWTSGTSRVCTGCGATTVPNNDPTFVPMSYAGENISGIVTSRPVGSHYLIYNEPDVPTQANHPPDRAADNYFDLYRAIKAIDGTAKVGGIGLVYIAADGHCDEGPSPPRPAGQDYLVKFLDRLKSRNDGTGGLDAKFDFYHVHAYYINGNGGASNSAGTSVTFERLWKHLTWLHGTLRVSYDTEIPANVPVWITETSRLGGSAWENVAFMGTLWNWLNSWGFGIGLIERVAWFSTRSGFSGTDLFEADLSTLTNLGGKWRVASMAVGQFRQLVVAVTGDGTRYKDYVWSHGMGVAPSGVVVSIGMTGVGRFWGVNTFNPSSTQVRFRIFHVDGENWANALTLTALGWWP